MQTEPTDALFTIVERGKKEWESAVDAISEGVALYDGQDLTIRRVNWPLARWLNTTPHQLVGASLSELLDDIELPDEELDALLRSSQQSSLEVERRTTGQHLVLSVFPTQKELPAKPDHAAPQHNVLVIRDVTYEKQLQREIIEAEKRAAMIRTVSGIAHQILPSINFIQQQLSIIGGHNAEMRCAFVDYRIALNDGRGAQNDGHPMGLDERETRRRLLGEEIENRHQVDLMSSDIDKAIDQITHDLMHIYKSLNDLRSIEKPSANLPYVDINRTLENSIIDIWPELGDKFTLERRYQKNLPMVRCNPLRLQTAFSNLLMCHVEQIEERGRLNLITQRQDGHVEVLIRISGRRCNAGYEPECETDPKTELISSIIQEQQGNLTQQIDPAGNLWTCVSLPVN